MISLHKLTPIYSIQESNTACGIIIHPGRKTFGRMGLVPWTPEGLDGDTFEQ